LIASQGDQSWKQEKEVEFSHTLILQFIFSFCTPVNVLSDLPLHKLTALCFALILNTSSKWKKFPIFGNR
jgi:hypothetical protein